MSESLGRPAAASTSGSAGRAPVRRGFEVYTPAARLAGRRVPTEVTAVAGNGHNAATIATATSRGHDLWEDTSEDPNSKIPKGDTAWKRDKWNEDEMLQASRRSGTRRGTPGTDSRSPPPTTLPRGRGAKGGTAGTLGVGSTGGAVGGGAVGGGGVPSRGGAEPVAVEVNVPSGEQFEDISRKVEEEVVAKLARAQVMGMMFKAHREQEMEVRRTGGGGGGAGIGPGAMGPRRRRADRSEGSGADRGENERGKGMRAAAAAADAVPPRQVLRPLGKAALGGVVDGAVPPQQQTAPMLGQSSGVRQPPHISGARAGASAERGLEIDDHRQQQQLQPRPGQGDAPHDVPKLPGAGATSGSAALTQAPNTSGLLRVPRKELTAGTGHPGSTIAAENLGADLEKMGLEEAYVIVGKLERQHKILIEEMRKDALSGIGVAGSRPGLFENGSPPGPGSTRSGLIARVRGVLSRALGSLIRRDAVLSLRKRLPNRLWMLHYREMEITQQQLRALSSANAGSESGPGVGGASVASRQKALRERLFELIEEAEGDLSGLVNAVEEQIAAAEEAKLTATSAATAVVVDEARDSDLPDGMDGGEEGSDKDTSDEEQEEDTSEESLGRRQALHTLLANLGDLARYRSLHGDHGTAGPGLSSSGQGQGGASGNSANALTGWARSEEFYRMALRVDPNSGKVWNQIAVLFSCRGDNLEAFYAYLRAVCAVTPFNGCRENLLVLHEKCKARLSTLREATALDALGMEEHQARFRLYLLGACGTCLSRIDLGTFDGYLALAERHMVSCIQLYLMKSAPSGGLEADAVEGAKGLEGTLARAIILCVCTASASLEGWQARGMEGGSWTQDAATSRAVRLCMSLASALAGLHRRTSKRGWERLTAAGVGVFLDWLVCRPQFGEGARGTGLDDFQHVMACVVEFANGVVRAAAAESANRAAGGNAFSSSRARAAAAAAAKAMSETDVDPDGSLWEDEECRGLPALEMVADRRASKARRLARALGRQEQGSTGSVATTAPSAASTGRGAFSPATRGGGRGGVRGGRRGGGGRGTAGRRSGKSRSASDDDVAEDRAGGSLSGGIDAWMIRVARIRQQVEFCVERGWIARGGRPGTYTLPKPPSRSSPPPTPMLAGKDNYGDYDEAEAEFSASVAALSDEGRDERRGPGLMDGTVGGLGVGVGADGIPDANAHVDVDSALNRTLDPEKDLEGFDLSEIVNDNDMIGGQVPVVGESEQMVRGRGAADGAGGTNGALRQDGVGEAPYLPPPGLVPDEDVQANAYASLSQRSPRGGDLEHGAVDEVGQGCQPRVAASAASVTAVSSGGLPRPRQPRVPVIPPGQHQGVVQSSGVSTGLGAKHPLPLTPTPTPIQQAALGMNPVASTASPATTKLGRIGKESSFVSPPHPLPEVPLLPHQQGVVAPGKSSMPPTGSSHQPEVYRDAEAAAVAQALSSLHLEIEARENRHGFARGEGLVEEDTEVVTKAGEIIAGQFGLGREDGQERQGQQQQQQQQQPYVVAGKSEWDAAAGVVRAPSGDGIGGGGGGVPGAGFGVDGSFPGLAPGPGLLAPSDLTMVADVNAASATSGAAVGAAANATENTTAALVSHTSGADPAGKNDGRHGELPESLLGIVLAGLGPADEHLCPYCCATLSPGLESCTLCGTPVTCVVPREGVSPQAGEGKEFSPGGVVVPGTVPVPVPVGRGRDVDVLATGIAVERAQDVGVAVGVGSNARQGKGNQGSAAALPAGVLPVNNMAEVMASSHRPKQSVASIGLGATAAVAKGGARGRARDASNPAVIARAGMGDGGVIVSAGRGGGGGGGGGGGAAGSRGKTFGWPRGAPTPSALPLVVIDVPNVAMRHGLKKKFSCKGVQMAIEFFRTAGHRVVGFIPDYYLDEKATNGLERAQKLGVAEVKASRLADDVPLLKALVDDGLLVATPPQDYDDSYCIKYAMARDGYVVTNDLYRDHVKAIDGRKKADAARRWIKAHSISFTFVGDEFFPNPDFSFNQDQGGAA